MATARVDSKGRLTIPKEAREALGIQPGDTFFVEREGRVLRYAKAENPFDGLARHAAAEHTAGKTRSLREIAGEQGIDLDGE